MRSLKYIVHGQSLERDNSCDFSNIVAGSKKYLMLQFFDHLLLLQDKSIFFVLPLIHLEQNIHY